jgi:T5SS/PEP-CTERM-associated repeat protein
MYLVKATFTVAVAITFLFNGTPSQAQTTYNWTDPFGGLYQDIGNWDLGLVPGPLDHAVLNTPAANYTVFFDTSPTADRASILGDDVIFDMQGRVYTLIGANGEGLRVEELSGTGSLQIIDGRINTTGDAILEADVISFNPQMYIHSDGKFYADTLTVGENISGTLAMDNYGRLEVQRSITIGKYGFGEVFVDGNSGPAVVWNNPGGTGSTGLAYGPGSMANLNLDGPGALWQTSVVFMGQGDNSGGMANISVSNDAHLLVEGPIFVGNDPGTTLDLFGGKITADRINVSPNGNFFYWAGTVELTNSDLTVDIGGLFGSTVAVSPGDRIAISGTTTVEPSGLIDINGGSFSTGTLDVQGDPGRLSWLAGGLGLTASDLTVGSGELLGDFISIDPVRSLAVGGTTFIDPGGFIAVDGGSFSTGALDTQGDPGTFNFNSGEFNLTASDLTVQIDGVLGDFILLDSTQKVGVSGLTEIMPGAYLGINGGTLSTGALDFAGDPLLFDWTDGTLNLTNSDLEVSGVGLLGDTLLLDATHTMGVNGQLWVLPDGTLHVGAGSLTVGQSTDHPAPTTLRLDTGGLLIVDGYAVVGSLGMPIDYNILTVESDGVFELTGGHLIAAEIDLAPGSVFDWQTGTLELTQGEVFVDPSGRFGAELLLEGGQELILGEVLPPGLGYLYAGGPSGAGELIIREGGAATTAGGLIDIDGVATVQGKNSRWTVRESLDVTNGLLRIEAGGLIETNMTSIHSDGSGPGHVIIEGPNSHLEAIGSLDIVDEGRLTIRDGATAQTAQVSLFDFGTASGPQATVQGPGSTWVVDLALDIGTNVLSPNTSFVYVIEGGALDAGGAMVSVMDKGELVIDDGLVIADMLDLSSSASFTMTDAVLRVNQLNFTTSAFTADGSLQIGHAGGSASGTVDLNAKTLSVTGTSELVIGYDAPATLTIQNGSTVYATTGIIGGDEGSNGHVIVTGFSSEWDNSGRLYVGGDPGFNDNGGDGTLDILTGARVNTMGGHIGMEAGSTGIVNVTGTDAKWINCCSFADVNEWLTVGVQGAGELHISAGGEVESGIVAVATNLPNGTLDASGTVTVDGINSLLDAYGLLTMGGLGTGHVTASNQAHINTQNVLILRQGNLRIESAATIVSTTEVSIGQSGTDPADATVTGLNSSWTNTGTLTIGLLSPGSLTVTDQATMSTLDTTIGFNTDMGKIGQGHITVSNDAQLDIDGELIVGYFAEGDLTITSGGRVVISPTSPNIKVGYVPSDGLIEVTGLGSELVADNQTLIIGATTGTGTMNIRDHGTVLSQDAVVGEDFSADGTVLVENPGSIWNLSGELKVGASAIGLVEVQDSGLIASNTGVIGAASGSNGTVNVMGSNSNWNINGLITIGRSGEGYFRVTDGAQVTNATAYIADNSGSIGQAQVYGVGSSWDTSGNVFVGGDNSGSGGAGDMTAGNGPGTDGTINIGGTLNVRTPGTVYMYGGVINAARLSTVNGTWNWTGGEFNLTDPTFEFVVGAAGPFGASLTIPTDNLMTVQGQTTVDSGAVLDAAGFTGFNRVVNEGTIKSSGNVILGDALMYQSYSGGGLLDVGAHNVTLHSLGFLVLDFPMNLTGGTLTVPNGLLIKAASIRSVHGTIDARLAVPMGTTITATGNLALGDASQSDGFFSDGVLEVDTHTVTLADANLAVLGSLTTLGGGGGGGAVVAPNGMLIEFGKNVTGFGSVDIPNDPLTPTVNNGDISGNSLAEPITLSGYVKGVGTFDNVAFTGTYAPGFSPATVYLGSAQYEGSLEIELGGLTEGDSDLLHHSGDLILGGVLDVSLWDSFVPSPGSVIDIMTYAGNLSGAFTGVTNSTGYAGLILGYTTDADSVMITTGYLAGDLNLDGFVGIEDLNTVLSVWNQNVTAGNIFQGDPSGDGFVGIEDLNVVLGNWNAGTPPTSNANIPEPGTLTMLLLSGTALVRRGKRRV